MALKILRFPIPCHSAAITYFSDLCPKNSHSIRDIGVNVLSIIEHGHIILVQFPYIQIPQIAVQLIGNTDKLVPEFIWRSGSQRHIMPIDMSPRLIILYKVG